MNELAINEYVSTGMEQLLPLHFDEQGNVKVWGRDLHEKLEIGTRYNDWFPRMCEYGFSEGNDFCSKLSKTSELGGRPATNHELTLDMAKELAMIQRNEIGSKVRKYLIEVEKAWNTPEKVLARALQIANQTIERGKQEIAQIALRAEQAENTVAILTHVNKTYTMTEIAKELNLKSAIVLNNWLSEQHIQYKSNGTWVFYSKYSDLGYEQIKQEVLDNGRVVYHRRITQRGREFIIKLYKEERVA